MELMDRVKQVADEVRETAKKGASRIQAKIEETQLRRKADDAARRLGYLIHRERTGGATSAAETDALVAKITETQARLAAEPTDETGMTESSTASPAASAQQPPTPPSTSPPMTTPPTPRPSSTATSSESPVTSAPTEQRASRRSSAAGRPSTPPPAPEEAPEEGAGE